MGVTEAARRLGVSTSQVSYWVKSGKITAQRVTVGGLVILLYKLPSWRGVGEGEVGSRRLGPVR